MEWLVRRVRRVVGGVKSLWRRGEGFLGNQGYSGVAFFRREEGFYIFVGGGFALARNSLQAQVLACACLSQENKPERWFCGGYTGKIHERFHLSLCWPQICPDLVDSYLRTRLFCDIIRENRIRHLSATNQSLSEPGRATAHPAWSSL